MFYANTVLTYWYINANQFLVKIFSSYVRLGKTGLFAKLKLSYLLLHWQPQLCQSLCRHHHIPPHLFRSLTISLHACTPRSLGSSFTTSSQLFLGLLQGLLPFGFHSITTLIISSPIFLIIWHNHCVLCHFM